jgi:hypothetical protein
MTMLVLTGCAGLGGETRRNVGPGGVFDSNTGIVTKPSKYSVAETMGKMEASAKAVAWQDAQGKVWLSYTNGTYINQRYAIAGAANAAKDIDATIEKMTNEALK